MLLLVVLSLLVMFSMVTVTFMLVAGQYKRMSRIAGRAELVGSDPRKQLDEAYAQLARGTLNSQSSLYGHDLLNDLYGNDGLKVVNTGATGISFAYPTVNGNLVKSFIDIQIPAANVLPMPQPGMPTTFNAGQLLQLQTPGHFNGCVLTFLDGTYPNQSARVVGWGVNGTNYVARIFAGEQMNALPTNVTRLLINGRPFNGTGFGLNPTGGNPTSDPTLLSALDGTNTYFQALLPNPRTFPNTASATGYSASYPFFGGYGGADEDYDVADPQNMALAYVPLRDATGPTRADILPSFHRSDLINYYQQSLGGNIPSVVMRQAMLRPFGQIFAVNGAPYSNPTDHPNFTGSNPSFDPVNGPWDVDNDGDGLAESVWVDIGLPVQTAPDGRRYKPLVAYHCIDLDGRLNVNAHGNWAQADPANLYNTNATTGGIPITPNGGPPYNIASYLTPPLGVTLPQVTLPRGSGLGPAEINLGAQLLPNTGLFNTVSGASYANLLTGAVTPGGVRYAGRYGEWGATPIAGVNPTNVSPSPLFPGADDILDQLRRYDMPLYGTAPNYYWNFYTNTNATNYGSPIDLWARAAVGIDFAGQPIWSYHALGGMGVSDTLGVAPNELPNDPYTLNLSRRRVRGAADPALAADGTFTPAELERILRRYDLDASALPDRLRYLLDPNNSNNSNVVDLAHLVTTDSFDLPTPPALAPRDMIANAPNIVSTLGLNQASQLSMVDLLKYRMVTIGGLTLSSITPQMIAQLLPPEVIAGQRFDLNRPFGNGIDDDGDGIVDEPTYPPSGTPAENETAFWSSLVLAGLPGNFTTGIVPDYSNGGDADNDTTYGEVQDSQMSRQLYARYLYVMMMVLSDTSYSWSWSTDTAATGNFQVLNARRIAQWAINVVDFRDSDSIMTPFEYDVNPFDGWGVDGLLSTTNDPAASISQRDVVWGVEAPSLLLTETLALHDRRVQDTSSDNGIGKTVAQGDSNFDQVRVPEGSLFLELYCTDNGNTSMAGGADLSKAALDRSLLPGYHDDAEYLEAESGRACAFGRRLYLSGLAHCHPSQHAADAGDKQHQPARKPTSRHGQFRPRAACAGQPSGNRARLARLLERVRHQQPVRRGRAARATRVVHAWGSHRASQRSPQELF